jgi:nuclease HARBI1
MAAYIHVCRNERVFRDRVDVLSLYSDDAFYKRYRFSKPVFTMLCNSLREELQHATHRNEALSVENQLACALRYYATGSFQQVVGDTLHVSVSTVNRVITRVSTALTNKLNEHVKFPNAGERDIQKQMFYNIVGFPGVVGAIDGTHIRIKRPSENPVQFFNRKCYYSINVMAVCNANRQFVSIAIREPGCAHDSRVLRNSRLFDKFENGQYDGILLGDSGYPCKKWLMTPVGNPVNAAENR